MAPSRRKKPRPERKTDPQGSLGDGGDREPAGRAGFADTSEIEFDFGGDAEFVPGRPLKPSSREATEGNGAGAAPALPRRDRIARRVERERPAIPAAPERSPENGGGNGRPPGGVLPPPPPRPPRFPPSATDPG